MAIDARVEVDDIGKPTGIEAEEFEDSPEHIDQPYDPDQIDVTTRNPTIDLLLSRIRNGSIDLQPDFQRRSGLWTDQRQSRLIESLLLRIPLPTIYAAENDEDNWAIVDGVQRLTTITRFIEPSALHLSPLKLASLEYLGASYDGLTFEELPGRLKTRLRETELVLHLIRSGTPEEVKFNIFARINTGGVPLSAQELRHAMIPGLARNLLKELASSKEFVSATAGSVQDTRMADREMALRFVAFRQNDADTYFSADFDDYLRKAMRGINRLSRDDVDALTMDFRRAMQRAELIFEEHAFRKVYDVRAARYPINKALFDATSVSLAEISSEQAQYLIIHRSTVMAQFIELMRDYDFDRSISQGTGDVSKVRYRFRAMRRMIQGVLDAK